MKVRSASILSILDDMSAADLAPDPRRLVVSARRLSVWVRCCCTASPLPSIFASRLAIFQSISVRRVSMPRSSKAKTVTAIAPMVSTLAGVIKSRQVHVSDLAINFFAQMRSSLKTRSICRFDARSDKIFHRQVATGQPSPH